MGGSFCSPVFTSDSENYYLLREFKLYEILFALNCIVLRGFICVRPKKEGKFQRFLKVKKKEDTLLKKKSITIVGIGNGALACAADLTLRGFEVTLYADKRYEERMLDLKETKTIELTGVGIKGIAKIHSVTNDPVEAFANDLVMPVLPAYGQEKFAYETMPYLRNGHKLILAPGSTGGALVISKILHENDKLKGVKIAEMHTLPYAARKISNTKVYIYLECKTLYFAAFPAIYNEELYKDAVELYPAVELVTDVLESSLNNGNPVSHPAPMVLNSGKIEYGIKHYHYREGITPSVARVNEQIDVERQEICKALGYKAIHIKDRLYKMGYAPKRETLYECYRDSEAFDPLEGPNDLSNRYLTEDTPYSLVLLSHLGKSLGTQTKTMDSIITLASILRQEDYDETGRSLEDLNLDGMGINDIKEFLQYGYYIDEERTAV